MKLSFDSIVFIFKSIWPNFLLGLLFFPINVFSNTVNDSLKQSIIEYKFEKIQKKFKAPYVTVQELKDTLIESSILIDVREPKELLYGRIKSAITLEEFKELKDIPEDQSIIVYCTIGHRSAKVTNQLRRQGYQAFNLKGGVLSWSHLQQKFYKNYNQSEIETDTIHVYSKGWNFLNSEYKPIF